MNNGNKGKFSERIKKIRWFRTRHGKRFLVEEKEKEDNSRKIITNFTKVMAAIPLIVYDNIFLNDDNNSDKKKTVDEKQKNILSLASDTKKREVLRKKNREIIKNINVSLNDIQKECCDENVEVKDKKQVKETLKKENVHSKNDLKVENKIDEKEKTIKILEKKIIDRIKKNLIKTINELEVLESEMYILSKINGDERDYFECKEHLKEAKNILHKINKLKEQYDFLRDNVDFEYLLLIDDKNLIDDIIYLKDLVSVSSLEDITKDYKLLDVYKYLYLKIDEIDDYSYLLTDKKNKQLDLLEERDIDFSSFKDDVYNVDAVNKSYEHFIKEQNEYLNKLSDDITKIDSHEVVSYRLNGFNGLLFNSFKYVGLLMMSPLRGLLPSIATETLITRNVISNLYDNLQWEESRKMVYKAIDYSSMLNNAVNNIDSTLKMVDSSLYDIVNLKITYNQKFSNYEKDYSSYKETIRIINTVQNKLIGNKMKLEIMKRKAKERKLENEKKLKLVKKLNQNQDNN